MVSEQKILNLMNDYNKTFECHNLVPQLRYFNDYIDLLDRKN